MPGAAQYPAAPSPQLSLLPARAQEPLRPTPRSASNSSCTSTPVIPSDSTPSPVTYPANQESRPFPLKDGDILQLGVDYQGSAEDIYKSVKIRVEIGREWQASANAFNTTALKNLKNLAAVVGPAAPLAIPGDSVKGNTVKPAKLQIPDCCIYLEEDVEVEPTDLDEDADADLEIDDVPANSKESGGANQSDNAGVATAAPTPSRATESAQHREDAEMSDGSFNAAPPPLSRPALNPLPPIPLTSGRLLPITERERFHLSTERDREAGGETEVEPDSVGQLSLSSRRVRGTGTGGGGASNARERARYLSTLLSGGVGGGGVCTDDEGMGNGNGVDEVDEVKMGDAIKYDGSEEDLAMDEEHDHVGIAVGIVTADGIAELGVGLSGSMARSIGPGGSIGGKRKW
ncbi:hypothetical protein F5887DRAFT_1077023 [Amanita rubescens]|nr:hypothetical protein F5887DRAFT_1077023 [Amanita rubescens]